MLIGRKLLKLQVLNAATTNGEWTSWVTPPSKLTICSYVCGENIRGYDHFGDGRNTSKCPVQDSFGVEERHRRDVDKAEEAARRRIQAEKPDITAEELKIQVVSVSLC